MEALVREIREGLLTDILGKNLYYKKQVDSTNTWARELANAGVPEGTLVLAESQSAGRGRQGRQWCSPGGGIWLSLILRPQIPLQQVQMMTLLTAVVLRETIEAVLGLSAEIKWPNDLQYKGKKFAGILTEIAADKDSLRFLLVGVGINANVKIESLPADLHRQATSLCLETGAKVDSKELILQFIQRYEQEYLRAQREGFADILRRWRQYTVTLGREVTIHCNGCSIKGKALDINEQGALLVKTSTGVRICWAGDVINQ